MELKDQYNVGDIRMHTVLLFNQEAVRLCGPICQDLYGTYPGVTPDQYPQAAKKIASWLLQRFAEHRQRRVPGVQRHVRDQQHGPGRAGLLVLRLAQRHQDADGAVAHLRPGREGTRGGQRRRRAAGHRWTTPSPCRPTPTSSDSDGDCLDDGFEARRADQGFKPANDLDARGCDPKSPLTPGCVCRDTDGDGLSQFAEDYLETRAGIVDSDGDGMPDAMEARYGLDPRTPNVSDIDTDGDGIPDAEELRAGSDPTRRDTDFYERYGYQYSVTVTEKRDNGSTCYDFTVSNLQMVTPPIRAGEQQGYNLFKVWFAEAPESGVATDYGVWRTACAWAQFAPPSVRVPASAELSLAYTDQDAQRGKHNPGDPVFYSPRLLTTAAQYARNCVGYEPGTSPPPEATP